MNRWEDNIFGMLSREEWLNIGTQVVRPNDPIEGLFSDEKTDNLMAYWETLAAEYQVPMMAQFHGFDTEANTTFRVPIDVHNIEKGLIKVKINQSERLRALKNRGVVNDEALADYVLNDGARLADQVVTRTKVAKNELMATGKVSIRENNVDLTVDYGVPADQTAFTLSFADDADVLEQIQLIVDASIDKGNPVTGMLTSRQNMTKMRKHASVQKAINGANGSGAIVRESDLRAFLNEEYGIDTIITNDLKYGADATIDEDGRPSIDQKRYYPANKVTFFSANPGGKVGTGLWGAPPEVDATEYMQVGASELSPFVWISQWGEHDPAVIWTKASGLFMPVLYNPTSLFIATVQGA